MQIPLAAILIHRQPDNRVINPHKIPPGSEFVDILKRMTHNPIDSKISAREISARSIENQTNRH